MSQLEGRSPSATPMEGPPPPIPAESNVNVDLDLDTVLADLVNDSKGIAADEQWAGVVELNIKMQSLLEYIKKTSQTIRASDISAEKKTKAVKHLKGVAESMQKFMIEIGNLEDGARQTGRPLTDDEISRTTKKFMEEIDYQTKSVTIIKKEAGVEMTGE